ncbi:SUMF1/EgtB/PvdO family nonheme iron enzyme [Aquisalimonas asiatica]|uniref:Ergothioneine biosynthesis protein EgtB n=1 Tax=Aquisalimonas asiatica TaxID=406100 RepID=A0A1H8VV22_9GAMM|nr:SUMF1/EgtB/PvdO family nonheme iron enzyme [Aquisalimonas asiatica]SEP19133.1 ergothioneine biosynthesis protein EgtB [Aquisalimonas asiatica]
MPRQPRCEQPTANDAAESALEALARHHAAGARLGEHLDDAHLFQQFHPDLSPIGWHLGHCAMVEQHWIGERILAEPPDPSLHALYFPELSAKDGRAARLPDRAKLTAWTAAIHARTRDLLATPPEALASHPLMRDDYLVHFLEQHYAQHHETLAYCLSAITASANAGTMAPAALEQLEPRPLSREVVTVQAGTYTVGTDDVRGYDNERPAHRVQLAGARLARTPVSNAQWLAFMVNGGYDTPEHWTASGDAWRRSAAARHPWTWQPVRPGCYLWNGPNGPKPLQADAPVSGINHYEAQAFARWAGARLPHEFEWEVAAAQNRLDATGTVWEWCGNALAPYPGFQPFPYDGYSLPWFDGRHFVLRGGSRFTDPALKRPGFRNFFEPHVRHQQAGLRLAWDLAR